MPGKIVQVVADGRPGGGTTAVLGLCKDLHDAGREVVLITDRNSYAAGMARGIGLTVTELPFFPSRYDPRVVWGLSSALRTLCPALVHGHGARAALPLSIVPRANENRVYTVHGYHFLGKSGVAQRLAKAAERRISRFSDSVVFVSETDRTIAFNAGIKTSAAGVIYNGINLDDLAPPPAAISYDLIFSARMHRQKNPLFAIDLMTVLEPLGIRMLMVGGGELEEQVSAAIHSAGLNDAIHLSGALPREQALAALRTARLFVMPSLWEGLPIAPIEALASGVPVVGSDIAGTREVVTHGKTGVLLPNFDPVLWANAISALLAKPELIATMANAGRADVKRRFLRERSSAAHLALYDKLMLKTSNV